MKQIQITITDEGSKILESYCKENNVSQQNAINMILVNYNSLKKRGEKKWKK